MDEIINILHQGNFSCVIRNGDDIRTFTQRGVADLYDLLHHEPDFLKGASIADKVVGKAAAALMILGGIKQLYTDIISTPALELLRGSDIEVSFNVSVSHIINRTQTDWCPMEKLSYEQTSAVAILPLITNFLNEIRKKAE
jgi:iron complex outermembrane receptor protein